ncbi:MAG: OmpA family protein [Polyangiaceae bacterium]|nr:OmpA family protein [Polyangiaceae bacterium]
MKIRKLVVPFVALLLVSTGCTFTATTGTANDPANEPAAPAAQEPTQEPAAEQPSQRSGRRSRVKNENGRLRLAGPVYFQTGKADIDPKSEATLEDLRLFLDENQQITKLRIEGHTDNVGQPVDNLKLSGDRAKAVRIWLVNRGIASSRLVSVGFGDTKPVAPNDTADNRDKNRRTEYVVVEVGGKPWRGADATGGGTVFE